MQSIGYIEVVGLSSSIVVSDKMLKTAAVTIKNVENTKGGGYITVSVTGDVAAVQAAIDAGKSIPNVKVVSAIVIPNPAEGIPELGKTDAFKDQAPFTSYSTNDPSAPTADEKTKQVVNDKDATQPKGSEESPQSKARGRRTTRKNNSRTTQSNRSKTKGTNSNKNSFDNDNSDKK